MSLRVRLVWVLAAFTAAVIGLFALFAMSFAFSVEDRFIEREMQRVAAPLREAHAQSGRWPVPAAPGQQLIEQVSQLPAELAEVLLREPRRREIFGADGRHYHLLPLAQPGGPPWLLAEVSDQLVVRPMRAELLGWLVGWGLALLALAALLGAWLGRRFDALLAREQAFSRDASHELRTPLAVLRMGLEREGPEPLRAAVRQMEQTLTALLLLSREIAPGRCQPLPLVEDWGLAHVPALDARGLRLDCQLRRDDSFALPALLLQAVLNTLLANALTHAEAGGRIEVAMRNGRLGVLNPGIGSEAGTGLGLPLVRRLLAPLGAELQFTQQQGRTEAWIHVG